ncbi:MAG: PepSY domain-containing protein [Zoogloea sp.]|nr:PepSY domain-containing protein [Zoogloea sp.]MCA0188561.1 PepSY domain-containing protein [Pseudomonadota bacterium]
MRAAARRRWLTVHLWLGLGAGLLFALLGLTGSALVFYPELDGLLNPAIRVARPAAPPSPDAVLARLRALHPERTGPWRIEMPLGPQRPLMVRYYNPLETAGRGFAPLMLTLDPGTLEETSQRFWGEYAVTWLYDLHYTLLLGQTGRDVVGYAGLVLLASLLSGVVLWWPSRARLAAALKPQLRPGMVRATYDLHVLSGVYGGLLLIVLAFTGSVLGLPELARGGVEAFSPLTPFYRAPGGLVEEGGPSLSLDEAVAIARREFPDGELRWIETPGAAGRPISVRLHTPGEPGRRFPRAQVWIDPSSAAVLHVRAPRAGSAGDGFMAWMHPLHNGEAFGLMGRVLACLAGLVPAVLVVTGWVRWRHKARARANARGHAGAASAARGL